MAPPVKRKIRLSDATVKNLPIGRSWDSDIGGFGVKVYSSGKRQFILRYRSEQRQREFRLGQFGVIGTDEARRKAKVLLGRIAEGADPAWERKIQLASVTTFGEVADKYLGWAEGHHKPTSMAEVRRYVRLHIKPSFGDFTVTQISRGKVQRIYDRMQHAPHFRAKVIRWSRTIWSWGEKRELVGSGRNPFVIDVNVPRPRRSRILAPEEYRALWLAIDALRYQGTVKRVSLWAIQFLVLTPLRKTEVFRLRWEHVDRDRGIIQVHEHKTDHFEEPLELFITEPLGHLLDSMSMSSPWLFPSPESETGHISGVDRAWVTVRKESGLFEGHKRITLHDLRRSWTSVGAALGYGPEFMGKVIGNSARVNEEHYWHLQESLKREISTRIAASIVSFGLNATK